MAVDETDRPAVPAAPIALCAHCGHPLVAPLPERCPECGGRKIEPMPLSIQDATAALLVMAGVTFGMTMLCFAPSAAAFGTVPPPFWMAVVLLVDFSDRMVGLAAAGLAAGFVVLLNVGLFGGRCRAPLWLTVVAGLAWTGTGAILVSSFLDAEPSGLEHREFWPGLAVWIGAAVATALAWPRRGVSFAHARTILTRFILSGWLVLAAFPAYAEIW